MFRDFLRPKNTQPPLINSPVTSLNIILSELRQRRMRKTRVFITEYPLEPVRRLRIRFDVVDRVARPLVDLFADRLF